MTIVEKQEELVGPISQALNIKEKQVQAVLDLLKDGNTIPFIARYRKEATGSLDEVQIHEIDKQYRYAENLSQRKLEVAKSIQEQDKWTEELADSIQQAKTLQQVEDLYRPFKQKRRTKAMIAIENGLEPLANWIKQVHDDKVDIDSKVTEFITDVVIDREMALEGVHEILAQEVGERADFREFIRKYTRYNGVWVAKLKDESLDDRGVYQMYYDFQEKLVNLAEHRVLATNRAEKEGVLTVKIVVDEDPAIQYMEKYLLNPGLSAVQTTIIKSAIADAYKRFIAPSIERELRNEQTEKADMHAIDIFGENLRHLLLQPPLKGKTVLGLDPAYRTGCKLAVISETGRVLDKGVIYPHPPAPANKRAQAKTQLKTMIEEHQVDIIAIGNGTASRESETFVSELVKEIDRSVQFIVVNEAGASVYSASEIARQEFPDFQVEERSAVSIARRLQDPLAELIKIDPKSMGVGQYQHDVSQSLLNEELDFVVNMTVNQVGVDINTASIQLLERVSGMTASTAKNVILLRDEMGHFANREQIKKVKRLGPKTYEQAVGFLRIIDGENPLDQTSIHPESYAIATQILNHLNINLQDLGSANCSELLKGLDPQKIAEQYNIGLETAQDILKGLQNPTQDIRDNQEAPLLREDVLKMEDLSEGMNLQGIVRNVVDFGAFVDIGVKEDGLIHISKLLRQKGQFIKHPSDVVAVGDIVEVEVISVDIDRSRIGLKQLKK
ncbi:RNA-binding transcriptional accessory protein [Facklamia sp. DSM 111018]|uniref:RNA-binding transcriptional accessory protein n=1 Tax=Facklamia lactis TaxID=2749967 RepID=A0ABS0LRP2_9LACT|nr:Tex family protein [Facklamia lactis]MBG9980806.1 RNA-binding transcriptional accessory protein [Facklamia lactis]MBG9986831.1 RNA-binding transcriptional accessory protein [Facklamia lactis]